MRVLIYLCVRVIIWFLPEMSFSWPMKKRCSVLLFGYQDGGENACHGTLEQQWHRFCPAHHAYRQRSCARYHLTRTWEDANHGSSEPIEMFVRRLNRSLVSLAELALRQEHARILL